LLYDEKIWATPHLNGALPVSCLDSPASEGFDPCGLIF
jgi:hypothetical protein